MEEEDETTVCPICREKFGPSVVMLQCGHLFCVECIMFFLERHPQMAQTLKCPTCRTRVSIDQLSYLNTGETQTKEVRVKGSYGTKIESLVGDILDLHEKEPGVKSLVFSQWSDVLYIIGQALQENNIKFAKIKGRTKFQEQLNLFKSDPSVSVLMLPIASGANGLNLVEATHVFLVEPLINPAAERQACGRVRRISQTHETFVHRYVIKGTIEEKVIALSKQKSESDPWTLTSKKEMICCRYVM